MFAKFEERQAARPQTDLTLPVESLIPIAIDPLARITWVARAAVLIGLMVWPWQFARALGLGARRAGLMLMPAALVWGAVYLARTRPAAAVLTSRTE